MLALPLEKTRWGIPQRYIFNMPTLDITSGKLKENITHKYWQPTRQSQHNRKDKNTRCLQQMSTLTWKWLHTIHLINVNPLTVLLAQITWRCFHNIDLVPQNIILFPKHHTIPTNPEIPYTGLEGTLALLTWSLTTLFHYPITKP